jgi:hypothetical protein
MGSAAAQVRSDEGPKEVDGKAMPEPPAERKTDPLGTGVDASG